MNITKTELLWSRKCPLACSGCIMPTNRITHQGNNQDWVNGIRNIRNMGSEFVAIYGAEPTTRQQGLDIVIREIYAVGMKSTLITAFPTSRFIGRLVATTPLDSLSISWDGINTHKTRRSKSKMDWDYLDKYPQITDRSVIATVTKNNCDQLYHMATTANQHGFWFLFDLFHTYHGLQGKVGNEQGEEPPTQAQVAEMASAMLTLKESGGLIHVSKSYLEQLIYTYAGEPRKFWHCGGYENHGWLTIDADGSIYACDDFQIPYPGKKIWDELDFTEVEKWAKQTVLDCVGCAWNTHWDATMISNNLIELGTYIHNG